MNPLDGKSFAQFISRILVLTNCETINTNHLTSQKNEVKMKTNNGSKFFTAAIFSGILLLALFGISASNAKAQTLGRLTVDKDFCADNNNNTCNGKPASFPDNVQFTVEQGTFDEMTKVFTPDGGTLANISVDIKQNAKGSTTTGDIFAAGATFRVCEVTPPGFASLPRPGTTTGGSNQFTGDAGCLVITNINSGNNVLKFLNFPVGTVTIIKDVLNGNSTTSFDFTATGLSPSSFSLMDTGNSSADRIVFRNVTLGTKTVTEALTGGFSLTDLTCTNGTTSTNGNITTRTATINVQQGDNFICTFTNSILRPTAAGADISGRIIANTGRAISRATVTVFNTNTLESRSVITNRYGYFGFQEMTVGDFYLISVNSKGYWFATNNQGIGLTESLTELEFIGIPFNNSVFGTSIFNDVIKSKVKQP